MRRWWWLLVCVAGCGELDFGPASVRLENQTTEALVVVEAVITDRAGQVRRVSLGPERVRSRRSHTWPSVLPLEPGDRLGVDVEATTLGVTEGWLLQPETMPGEVLELVHDFDIAAGRAALRWRWALR